MTAFQVYRTAADALAKSRSPLIVLLKDVDPDAMGASMALARAFVQRGVRPTLFCLQDIPDSLLFLSGSEYSVVHDPAALTFATYDLAIVCDAGDLKRTGIAEQLEALKQHAPLMNVDHHHVHSPFGTINLVDEHASASAELVYDVLQLGGWSIDAAMATAILAGIMADTGNFTNAATTIRSLEIAATCYAKGADAPRVVRELYGQKPLRALQLWGDILSRLQKNKKWGIVSTVILQKDFATYDISDEATEGLANFLNSIADMKAALILKEMPDGTIRGSMRATRDDVDVSKLAKRLGGGGHRKAAGFTIHGKIEQLPNGKWRVIPHDLKVVT